MKFNMANVTAKLIDICKFSANFVVVIAIDANREHINETNKKCDIVAVECSITAGRFYVYAVPKRTIDDNTATNKVGFNTIAYQFFLAGKMNASQLSDAEKISYWPDAGDGDNHNYIATGWQDRLNTSIKMFDISSSVCR